MTNISSDSFNSENFYPKAFSLFDKRSLRHQKAFLWLIYFGLLLTLLASVLSLPVFSFLKSYSEWSLFFGAALILLANLCSLEANWYRYRAVAESIKTLTWLYRLRIEGFENTVVFQEKIQFLIKGFKYPCFTSQDDLTELKPFLCFDNFLSKKTFYKRYRLAEQKKWYSSKADYNRLWNLGMRTALGFTLLFSGLSFWHDDINTSLISTILACLVAFYQTKRFKELYAAYSTTLSDIESVETMFNECSSMEELNQAILRCELAFSREHVRWLARVDNPVCDCCPHKIKFEKVSE